MHMKGGGHLAHVPATELCSMDKNKSSVLSEVYRGRAIRLNQAGV